jgi:hypothetical protein
MYMVQKKKGLLSSGEDKQIQSLHAADDSENPLQSLANMDGARAARKVWLCDGVLNDLEMRSILGKASYHHATGRF